MSTKQNVEIRKENITDRNHEWQNVQSFIAFSNAIQCTCMSSNVMLFAFQPHSTILVQ